MSLTPGARVGPYAIQSALGAGGMGEVYRARDSKLNRDVALKLLPEVFAFDSDRLARFRREAQLLASLNHPNIAAIYGVEETDGMPVLVLELVEGPTLAERIAQGPLPVDEALSIARQIADGLEAAHEQGVIHRDLKPANVKVRPDGTVKVLDFGLAKALDPGSGSDISQSPTLTTPAATMMGAILGTAAYMAPEQARGKVADKRADIWAFGVVLYEMLTGRRLFEGEGVTETLGAIIHKDPVWAALRPDTPPAIVELLHRCLTKDPRKRLRDIGEARIAIDQAMAAPIAVAAGAGPSRRAVGGERVALIVMTIAAIAALPLVFIHLRETTPVAPAVRFTVAPPDGAQFSGGANYSPAQAVSPDGRLIVFRAQRPGAAPLLWIRALDTLAARPLPDTEQGDFPFWSPDGRFIAFFADGKLKKTEVAGGPVQTLSDAPAPEGGTWNGDGTILFAATGTTALSRVSAAGGQATAATTLDATRKETSHRWPQFLPDGRRFLFLAQPGNAVSLGSLDSSEVKQLMNTDSKALYAAPGSLLFVRQGTLMAQPFDASRGELTGEAAPIAEQVRNNATNGRAGFSVSQNGVLAYRTADDTRGTPVWVDRNGRQLASLVNAPLEMATFPRLSPDGRRLALIVAGDLWVYDLDGRPPIKLTFDGGHFAPLWTPDGQHIVYESTPAAEGLRSLVADGSGGAPEAASLTGHYHPHGWSSEGRDLIVARLDGGATAPDILRIPGGRKNEPQPVVQTPANEGQLGAALSPDGRWLAYASNTTGQQEIWVRPYPGPGAAVRVSPSGGVEPVWARDGRELYYLESTKLMAVAIDARTTFNFSPPALLFESSYLHGGQPPSYDVAADRRFLMIKSPSVQTVATPVTVVVNWARR